MVKKSTKNKKKTWKRIDVKDVEDHLEDEWLKERLGPTDSQISFVIDTSAPKGSSTTQVLENKIPTTRQLKTTSDLTRNLKCFKSLTTRSKVQAMKPRTGPKARAAKVIKRKTGMTQFAVKKDENMDLWNTPETDQADELVQQQQKLCGKHVVRVPKSLKKKPNLVPAVVLPDPGLSYNPSDGDYSSLVNKVVKEEVARIRSQERVDQAVTKFYQPKSSSQIEAEYMQEMSQGLNVSDSDCGVDEEPVVVTSNKKAVRAENRKTKKQRNRELQIKHTERQRVNQKEVQKKAKQPLGLPKLLREIKLKEQEAEVRKKVRETKAKKRMLEPKRKNSRLLPEQVVPSPADIRGSLRSVKVACNLLEDRFGSLVARSLIEVKSKKKRKSAKSLPDKKLYVKRSHRSDVC